jgi:Zyg-11 family protein
LISLSYGGKDKTKIIGSLGGIEKMISLIDARINRRICDEVMIEAWTLMLNITDSSPDNCEHFLKNNGMSYFVSCDRSFPGDCELHRTMIGVIGNIVECAHLRPQLTDPKFIHIFIKYLESEDHRLSYDAVGLLSQIDSEGSDFWNRFMPIDCKRDDVVNRMKVTISRWKINTKLNYSYNSFKPFLHLLRSYQSTPEALHWAVWSLANLTRVDCSKYCPMLEENAIKLLEELICNETQSDINKLAQLTLYQYRKYKIQGNLGGMEESDEIDIF